MRAMIDGVWHERLPDAIGQGDSPAITPTPAARVGIDRERLANAPETYHLYAALACPFAHRVLLGRSLTFLELPLTLADPWLAAPGGWFFAVDPDSPVPEATRLWQVYRASDPHYSGQVSVPVLWDRLAGAIASAESDEILEAILAARGERAIPAVAIRGDGLDELCEWIRTQVNVAIYDVGFARTQAAYDDAHDRLAENLDRLEQALRGQQFLWQNRLSKADLYLFPTAIRFDVAYQGAFQLLDLRWSDFPGLQAHLERIAAIPAVARTIALDDYRRHYFDDGIFPLRHPAADGHYVIPRTPDPLRAGKKRPRNPGSLVAVRPHPRDRDRRREPATAKLPRSLKSLP